MQNCRVYATGGMDETLPMFYDGSMQNIKEHTDNSDVADFGLETNEPSHSSRGTESLPHGDCADNRAENYGGDRAESRAEGRAQVLFHSQLDGSGEEDFAGFVKHNIASGGIFGGVLEKGAAPQNRSATDWGIDVAVALVAFAFGCAQMVITASSVVHVDAGPYGSSWVNYVPNIYAYLAVALTTAPLILRREAPWFVLALTLACYVFLSNSMGGTVSLSPIGPIVAVYTVASERARGEALAAAAVVGVCAAVVPMGASSVAMALVMRIENVAFVVVAALGGFGVRM